MVNQSYREVDCCKLLFCCIKAATAYEEFLVVIFTNAEKCTVQGQHSKTTVVDGENFNRTACGIDGKRPDGFEIVVVPFRERLKLLGQMICGRVRIKIFIGIFLGIEGSDKKFT